MSTLTIALASLGGVVLAGVVAQGAWQARKAGPRRADAPSPRAEPREPVMDDVEQVSPSDDAVVDDAAPVERRLPRRALLRLDALIDAMATLRLDAPVGGAMALAHLPTTRRAGGKPFLIEGLNAETGEWEQPVSGQRYGEFQAGVQLANRTGPLNEIEYSEFVQKIQGFAEAIGAMTDFPDMLEVVASARELDAFANQYDAQLVVQLRTRATAWSVAYVQQHAGAQGFVAGAVPGRWVLPSAEEGGPPVLSLTFDAQAALADDPNEAAVREVSVSFDVPQTDPAGQPFQAWQTVSQALAEDMQAELVDDNGAALSQAGFTAIGAELGQLYEALNGRDLPAGSAAARRLFS